MKDGAPHPVPVEVICDAQQPKGHVIHPHELADGFVVVIEFRGVYDKTIEFSHSYPPCAHLSLLKIL